MDECEIYWKQYYIDLLGWENLLFCQLIDGKGGNKSEETKQKMSDVRKGIKFSLEQCLRISQNKKGKSVEKVKKPIIQYSLLGEYINTFESTKEAQRQTEINSSAINNNLKGISKNSGGFIWKYKK